MTTRIAITGATGFIGRALLARLLPAEGARVLVRRASAETDAWRRAGVEVVIGDLATTDALERLVRGADAVIHCAAWMGKAHPERSFTVNVVGTERLARVARAAGVRRFVHVSTISVYAATRQSLDVVTEDDVPCATDRLNHYGRTKWLAEQRLPAATGTELPWTVIRPTNVYGPWSGPWFLQWARYVRGVPFAIGDLEIDMVHVDDTADALLLAAADHRNGNHVLHVGHEMVPLNRFVQAVGHIVGHPVRKLPKGVDAALRHAIEGVVRLVTRRHMSMSLTRTVRYPHTRAALVLGYQPRVTLADGLERLAAWWRTTSIRSTVWHPEDTC